MSRYYYNDVDKHTFTFPDNANLLSVANYRYAGDWHSIPHTHNHTELFYIVSGKGRFLIQDQVFPVDSDSIIIINPNVLHTEVSLNAQPLEYIVLGMDGIELAKSENFNGQYCILKQYDRDGISSCLHNILREMDSKKADYEKICHSYMEILIVFLMRDIDISGKTGPRIISNNRQCAAVKRYIDQHFKEALTLEQLSEEAHINKYYLSHAFKREYGISPINYLISLRVEESKYLLSETDLTMSQIAQTLGFSSSSYFSQVFRKAHGCSPMEYRHKSRK